MEDLFVLAAEKDRGFDLKVFAEMTKRASSLDRIEFVLNDEQYANLQGEVNRWRMLAVDLARDKGLDKGRGR